MMNENTNLWENLEWNERLDKRLKPGLVYDVFLWLSLIAISAVGLKSLFSIDD